MNDMEKRIQSESKATIGITNQDLVCRDCVQRYDDGFIFGNVSKCEFYPVCKPIEVLNGGKCDQYVKE